MADSPRADETAAVAADSSYISDLERSPEAGEGPHTVTGADNADEDTPSATGPREPEPPARDISSEACEAIFQEALSIASLPSALRNPMSGVSLDILLRMAGKEDATFTATAPPDRVHPSRSLLLLLKRMNEEFRARVLALREEYEDAMEARRLMQAALIEHRRKAHGKRVRELHEEAQAQLHDSTVATRDAKAEEAQRLEIQQLEQMILDRAASSSGGGGSSGDSKEDVAARRLLVFWKAKYESLCGALEAQEDELRQTNEGIAEFGNLLKLEPLHVQRELNELREAETRERLKTEALRMRYVQECQKRNVTPKAEPPLISPTPAQGRTPAAGSRRDTDSVGAIDDVASNFSETRSHGLRTGVSGGVGAASYSGGHSSTLHGPAHGGAGGSSDDPSRERIGDRAQCITELGHRDARVVAAATRFQQREDEEAALRTSRDDLDMQLTSLAQNLESLQSQYATTVGKVSGPTASIYEEIIHLRGFIDGALASQRAHELSLCDEGVRHASTVLRITFDTERDRLLGRVRQESTRRFLREKDLDVLRGTKRQAAGLDVTLQDLSDAPPADTSLRVDALLSQLDVLDADRQLLRTQVEKAKLAVASTSSELDQRLNIGGSRH